MKDKIDFSILKDKWPSTFVARSQIGDFTGGLIAAGTMANLDSQGDGPDDSFRIGNKIGYPVDSVIRWLEARVTRKKLPPVKMSLGGVDHANTTVFKGEKE